MEPVTLEEAKNFLRIDTNEEDILIMSTITAARQAVEKYISRAIVTQPRKQYFSTIYEKAYLLYPPIQQITKVTKDGKEVSPDKYVLLEDAIYVLEPLIANTPKGIVIEYIAGYGDDVPRDICQAVLSTVAQLYESRESNEIPQNAKDLLRPYKVYLL